MNYPFEIATIVRNKTFSVEARFSSNREDAPLEVFDHFSRFPICLIENSKAATANIPVSEYMGILKRSEYAYSKYLDRQYANEAIEGENTSSIAYTKRFGAGKLKGKSPAEVLLTENDAMNVLKAQYDFLGENLAKYPRNKELMDAIVCATKLYKEGKLENNSIKDTHAAVITIYEASTRPNMYKPTRNGKNFCYEVHITFNLANKYPVNVKILNYYAPVKKLENGMLNVLLAQKDRDTEVSNEINLTADEWLNITKAMERNVENFFNTSYARAYNIAKEEDLKNRQLSSVKAG